jgi:hypothetical protein
LFYFFIRSCFRPGLKVETGIDPELNERFFVITDSREIFVEEAETIFV